MKKIIKSILKLVSVSIVAVAALTVAVAVSAEDTYSVMAGLSKNANGMWVGEFTTDDIRTYSSTFNEPTRYSIRVNGPGGPSTTITAKDGFAPLYKWSSVKVIIDGKTYSAFSPTNQAHSLSATATNAQKGKITEARYYGYIYNGTLESNGLAESSLIIINAS